MKTVYTSATQHYSIAGSFSTDIKLPEDATLKQLSTFNEKVESIRMTPMESVELAYMDAFGVELTDDAPNGDEVGHQVST